ncbi:hypothetical protein PSPO01_13115 [Paraphaeosphaeria sporulosa]
MLFESSFPQRLSFLRGPQLSVGFESSA